MFLQYFQKRHSNHAFGKQNLQNLPFPWDVDPYNTRIPWTTPLTIPNGIQIQSAVFPQFTNRTDRPTDRQINRQKG